MASERPGYLLFLALILARCVRGQHGVPFVIKYIVTNWTKFTREFPAFCKNLVAAAEKYSKDMGRTHLAHRDGLAAGFSGLQFLRTLKMKACRMQLIKIANNFKALFTRLLKHKGSTKLSDVEFTSVGNAMMGQICMAIHSKKKRFMRNYHAMDATRCFQASLQYGLGLKTFAYTKLVHEWVLNKQAKKFRDKMIKDMYYYGLKSHEDVAKEIEKLSSNTSGTIIYSTFFAHLCEVRQCINRFTLGGVAYLVTLYHTVTACKTAADTVMRSMKNGTWKKGGCYAVMVLDAVREAKNLTLQNVKEKATRVVQPWVVIRRMSALSPKLCLEGIPEWLALRSDLDLLIAKCMDSYSHLFKAARRLSINPHAFGRRLTKAQLQRAINAHLRAKKGDPFLTKKRKREDLVEEMVAAGGNPRPYNAAGKQMWMTKAQISEWLTKRK